MSSNNKDSETSFDSSVDFETARGDSSGSMVGPGGDLLEESDYTETDQTVKSNLTVSSVSSTKEDIEAAWSRLPSGARDIAFHAKSIIYMDRYQTFVHNNWPYDVKRGHLCHPRALALAGLEFHSLEPAPSAQCVVCRKVFILEIHSNPWISHSELSPDCLIIRLGQRDKVDDYSLDQILEMAFLKFYNDAKNAVKEKENLLKKNLYMLKKHEQAIGSHKSGSG